MSKAATSATVETLFTNDPTRTVHLLAQKNFGKSDRNGKALAISYEDTTLRKLIEKNPHQAKFILDYRDMMGTTDIDKAEYRAFSAKHAGFTAEQQQAIWQTRSNRSYYDGTYAKRTFGITVDSIAHWERVQDRKQVASLR
jgi:hypothetical protein